MELKSPTNYTTIASDFEFYSCKFSPFHNNLIACTLSQYYGMIGNGRVAVYQFDPVKSQINEIKRFATND